MQPIDLIKNIPYPSNYFNQTKEEKLLSQSYVYVNIKLNMKKILDEEGYKLSLSQAYSHALDQAKKNDYFELAQAIVDIADMYNINLDSYE